jgi:hypothetical protein
MMRAEGAAMSFNADHASKSARRACQACQERKARFQYQGEVRADRDHVLCFECYRSERDRTRARLHGGLPFCPIRTPSLSVRPGDRAIAHRRRMLRHLATVK